MINQNYLFRIFVTKNRSSNNKNIEFDIWVFHVLNLQKNIND